MAETKAQVEGTIFRDPPVKKGPSGRPPGRPPGGRAPSSAPSRPVAPPPTASQRDGMENSLTFLYGVAGLAIEQRGVQFTRPRQDGEGYERVWAPSLAGRAMKLGSPSAGKEISDWVNSVPFLAGILGPILGNRGFTTLSKVAGLPILMHVLQVRPESAPMIQPIVMPMLAGLFHDIKKMESEQRRALEAMADFGEESAEEFKAWVQAIFTQQEQVITDEPMPVEPPPPNDEEPLYPEQVAPAFSDDGFGEIDEALGAR